MGGVRTGPVSRLAVALVVAASALLVMAASPASAADDEYYDMIFPVVGDNHYNDTWGACRGSGCSRSHEGVDIMAAKMTPVVAVADGTVGWMHNEQGGNCCAMALYHDDGWASWYIHLNNDTPGTDDGQGWGFAEGITSGVHVRAGQLIGYVGDSGNAENSGSHLHFELHMPDGTKVNPTPAADGAQRIGEPLPAEWDGHFWDDDLTVHAGSIDLIADLGITRGCNPPANDQYCPHRTLTRGEIAAFLNRFIAPDPATEDYFADDGASIFEADINNITAIDVGFGCTEIDYCPDQELSRAEMAEMLVRAFAYDNPDDIDYFTDDDGSTYETSINALRHHEITAGCNPPDNDQFCPDRSLTRAEMATFFARALASLPPA